MPPKGSGKRKVHAKSHSKVAGAASAAARKVTPENMTRSKKDRESSDSPDSAPKKKRERKTKQDDDFEYEEELVLDVEEKKSNNDGSESESDFAPSSQSGDIESSEPSSGFVNDIGRLPQEEVVLDANDIAKLFAKNIMDYLHFETCGSCGLEESRVNLKCLYTSRDVESDLFKQIKNNGIYKKWYDKRCTSILNAEASGDVGVYTKYDISFAKVIREEISEDGFIKGCHVICKDCLRYLSLKPLPVSPLNVRQRRPFIHDEAGEAFEDDVSEYDEIHNNAYEDLELGNDDEDEEEEGADDGGAAREAAVVNTDSISPYSLVKSTFRGRLPEQFLDLSDVEISMCSLYTLVTYINMHGGKYQIDDRPRSRLDNLRLPVYHTTRTQCSPFRLLKV